MEPKAFATDGYADNGVERDPRYEIPDTVLKAPSIRRVRVLSVGAGITGIMNAYYIQKELDNIEHVIYEKNNDIGGVWYENRYPGCACDVPSHAYTLPFALNPDWPRFFSSGSEIWTYLNNVCDILDLRKHMNFNHKVIGCFWQQGQGEWLVKIERTSSDGSIYEFEDRCNVLLYGTGLLNHYQWPNIKGLETFKGRVIHTADWPVDYDSERWKSDRVAIIGSGASSVQTVPAMQPDVAHIDLFVRTGVWFVNIPSKLAHDHEYTTHQKEEFKKDPRALVEHAKDIEDGLGGFFPWMFKNSEGQKNAQIAIKKRMGEMIKDKRLLAGFTPKWSVGCKRPNPADPYMRSIQQPNVTVHFTPALEITPDCVVGADGTRCEVDTIICATGFDVSYRPRFPIIGQNNVNLQELWGRCPEGYMGIAAPGFPNLFIFQGPNSPIQNGSSLGSMWFATQYVIQMIAKIQSEYICSIEPRQDATDDFNAHCQEWVRHTVWSEDCGGWYKHPETGRMNSIWPGSSLHYMETIQTPRYEDYVITYLGPGKKNRFAYLGMGTARATVERGNPSPHLDISQLDVRWLKAMGADVTKVLASKMESQRQGRQGDIQKNEEGK